MPLIVNNQQKHDGLRKLYILAFSLLSFSYPITTVWLLQIGAPVSQFNFFIKAFISILFLSSFITTYPFERNIFSVSMPILIFFFSVIVIVFKI